MCAGGLSGGCPARKTLETVLGPPEKTKWSLPGRLQKLWGMPTKASEASPVWGVQEAVCVCLEVVERCPGVPAPGVAQHPPHSVWSRLAEPIRLPPAPLLLGAVLSLGFRGSGFRGLGFRFSGLGCKV